MEQPHEYEEANQKKYVVRLFKSIYRLKQAGWKWYNIICRTLADLGFERSKADPAVFFIHRGTNIVALTCHVDDCIITGSSQDLIQSYKDKLKTKYSLTDLGPAHWLLGIKITRDLNAHIIY